MIQEDLDFDTPHCRDCGVTLIPKVNWHDSSERIGSKICRDCKNSQRYANKEKYKKKNSDPNKVWDPEYLKTCCTCKKTQKAEEHHSKKLAEKDGYRNDCKACKAKINQTPRIKHSALKADSKKRGYEWTLKEQDTSGLLLSDCYYCGKPSQEGIKIHGLDRVENDRGYHLDNVVPCCYDCNIAKATQTQEDFIEMCKRVADRHTTYEKSNVEWIKVYLEDSGVGEIIKENFIDPIW
jgi:hypothetical protein